MKAVGQLRKNEAGNWHGKLQVADPHMCSFEAKAQPRMKDAMRICNGAARKLGWEIDQWEK